MVTAFWVVVAKVLALNGPDQGFQAIPCDLDADIKQGNNALNESANNLKNTDMVPSPRRRVLGILPFRRILAYRAKVVEERWLGQSRVWAVWIG